MFSPLNLSLLLGEIAISLSEIPIPVGPLGIRIALSQFLNAMPWWVAGPKEMAGSRRLHPREAERPCS